MKLIKFGSAALAILFFVFIFVGPYVVEWFAFRKNPELKKDYRTYQTEAYEIPSDTLAISTPSQETVQALADFNAEWKLREEEATAMQKEIAAVDLSSNSPDAVLIEQNVASLRPLIERFQILVNRPDYELSLLLPQPDDSSETPPMVNALQHNTMARLLTADARLKVRNGDISGALEASTSLMMASRAHIHDPLISHLLSAAYISTGASVWRDAIAATTDPAILRQSLEQQSAFQSKFVANSPSLPMAVEERLGFLRVYARAGVHSELPPNATERELTQLSYAAMADYQENIVLPRVKDNPEQKSRIEHLIHSNRNFAAKLGGKTSGISGVLGRLGYNYSEPVLFSMARANYNEIQTRTKIVSAKLDLLRLETAAKLHTLEKNSPPADLAALVPDYLKEIPGDRFDAANSAYRFANQTAYSIGPDKKDDAAALPYDPTNGTNSAGDIYFKTIPQSSKVALAQ